MSSGFGYWREGLTFIALFLFVVGFACFWVALIGSRMINEIGNFPTQSSRIQFAAAWKLILVEILAFSLLLMFYIFFNLK